MNAGTGEPVERWEGTGELVVAHDAPGAGFQRSELERANLDSTKASDLVPDRVAQAPDLPVPALGQGDGQV